MKTLIAIPVALALVSSALAQAGPTSVRPRVVQAPRGAEVPPAERPTVTSVPAARSSVALPTVDTTKVPTPLSFSQMRSKLEEAKREMTSRPIPTALTDSFGSTGIVRLAFYDVDTRKIDYLVFTKESMLQKNAVLSLTSSASKNVTLRVIRPNGVNTPVTISDDRGRFHVPLMAQYPVERNGVFYETAYYMSSHPGLVTPETVAAGKLYVRNQIDVAREKLRDAGFFTNSKVADIAERLCIVEHVDHYRFRAEYHPNVYNDVFTLYALNEGQTYRYSVSSAGAGGMIQMIPSTYQMVRNRFPGAGLMPDFVDGMRNHPNAAKAMLLYIQMTYDDLLANPTVAQAVQDGTATEMELLSAGYNSNPAKLSGYIRRGGPAWRSLIPRETQIYLEINRSMDLFVPIVPRRQ